ncbi:MAG TPA: hypothetical protein PK911_05090 [Candidatus Saccharibacteria bacterium]|nr:hypothetical protein [Candidatus Saccharibacteria bacterium]
MPKFELKIVLTKEVDLDTKSGAEAMLENNWWDSDFSGYEGEMEVKEIKESK